MEEDRNQRRLRSVSDPTGMFQMDKDVKKSGGLSHFFNKLPFLLGKHHRDHNGHSQSDDEFCDIETEMKKAGKKSHKHGNETDRNEKKHKDSPIVEEEKYAEGVVVMVNESTDTELDHRREEHEQGKEKSNEEMKLQPNTLTETNNGSGDADGKGSSDDLNNTKDDCCASESNPSSDGERSPIEEPLHEPPLTPLPPPPRSCLKQTSCLVCSDGGTKLIPLRNRSVSMPEGDPKIIYRLNRHVHFSPDMVEPTPRNCKYREWIERHSSHGSMKSLVKHEKRMQQLRQVHSLDINDYLSKGQRRYHNVMVASPMPAMGCDLFM